MERLESRRVLAAWGVDDSMPEAPPVGTCPVCGTGGCRHLTDETGLEYVACYLGDSAAERMTMSLEGMAALFPSSDTFNLSSRPLANHTIYLDFTGHVTSGTQWNTQVNNGLSFSTPAYSLDADFNNFSSTEHAAIQEIWARVAEDFAPFDVNVTTALPLLDDLRKTSSSDQQWGVRVVIGGDGAWYNNPTNSSAAGVAYIDSFNWNSDTPCFVFAGQSWNANLALVATVASHEAGHTLGLGHDGHNSQEYYGGRGSWFSEVSWGPIMGNPGFSQPIGLTQWSKGDYGGATNFEDDLAIITSRNGFGYRPDDHGNTFATATRFNNIGSTITAGGLIHTASDVDVFAFESNGTLLATISPAAVGANLDVAASLWTAAGAFVASSNPIDRIGASFALNVVPGLYYLVVGGTGMGDPATTGYTSYGSLGQYTVDVNRGAIPLPVVSVVATDSSAAEGLPTNNGRFTISRTGAAVDSLLVSFSIGGTATEGVDYARLPSVTFSPGQSSVFVDVFVNDDNEVEGSETVTLSINPTFVYTVGSPSTATVTIADNDFAPEIDVRGNGFSISDGDTTPSAGDHTDFGSIPIASGMLTRTFTIVNSGTGTLLLNGSPRVLVTGTHAGDFSVITTPPSSVAAGSSTTFEVRFAPSAAGLRSARISIANNDANENPFDFSIQGTGTLAPEIDVRGNGFSIPDGDTTPSSTDHTDFGDVLVAGSTLTRTYTVANSGTATLSLTGSPRVQVTGSHAGDFSVTVLPSNQIQAGSSTTFQIQFDPSAAGLRTARISIANDDADENPYDFSIHGTGTLPPAPDIDVRGNGVSLTSGDSTPSIGDNTDFGSTTITSGTVLRIFTVTNAGTATLTLSGSPRVQITGSHASDFSVVTQPASPLAANATTHFEVQFRPSAAGLRVGRVVIANDDADENPFEFAIQGTGTEPLVPEIDLRGNGVSIIVGDTTPSTADHTDFGTTSTTGGTVTRTFTVANTGTSTLSLTGSPLVQLTGSHANDFTIISWPASTVGAGSTTTFQVRFDPSAAGLRRATVVIANNDANENSYNFSIQGTGTTFAGPKIDVRAVDTSIANGDFSPSPYDNTDFGLRWWTVTTTVTYTIVNMGIEPLLFTGSPAVRLTGAHLSDFGVIAQPSTTLAPGATSSFQVRFRPLAAGVRSARVVIHSNDADGSPYEFAIQGTGADGGYPAYSEIDVQGNGVSIIHDDTMPSTADHTDFGSTSTTGGTVTRTFTVANTGTGTLSLMGSPFVQVTGSHADDFRVTSWPASTVGAGSSTTFQVTFDPSAAGLRTATVVIPNNDANEETYSFMIQGTGTAPTEWIIDDLLSSGFRRTGASWSSLSAPGMYGFGGLYAPKAGRPHEGHWTVGGLEPGRYRVMTTWRAAANRGSNVPYSLFDGSTRLREVRVNQRVAPNGESGSGVRWHSLGTVTISGGSLRVRMTNATNGVVVADAVRVVKEVPRPKMGVRGGTIEIVSGDTTPGRSDGTDFGLVLVGGGSAEASFTITNSGTGPLTLTGSPRVQVTGSHASDFRVDVQPSSPVAAGASSTFRVTFNPSATGVRTARIVIPNDDPDDSPYEFAIQGTGVATLESDIDVRWTTSSPSIPDGDTTPTPVDGTAFGAVAVGDSWTRFFTITNAGTASLSLAGSPRIEVSGSHAADFTIATMPAATVAPGSSTTFRLIFRPSAEGLRTARITIPSNDPDENPYDFSIQGTGMLVIDNRGPGFRRTGSGWTSVSTDAAYGGSLLYAFKAGRANAAHWEFTGLEPGRYKVMTTWRPHSNRGTNVPYSIHDGGLRVGEIRVNQRLAPDDDSGGGSFWHSLGTVAISRGSLRVTMTNAANGVVVADAVRIMRLETSAVAFGPTTAAATRFALIAAAQESMRDTKPATNGRGPRGR